MIFDDHVRQQQKKEWMIYFAWFPRTVGPDRVAWLQFLERRLVVTHRYSHYQQWEYREIFNGDEE